MEKKKIEEAIQVAKDADIIIVAVGENEQQSKEAGTGRMGDMCKLNPGCAQRPRARRRCQAKRAAFFR